MIKKYIIFDFDGTLIDTKTKELFDGIPEMLKNLSENYTLFLSSRSDDEDLKEFLKTEQLYWYFDIVFGSTIREKWKKHIEVFDLVSEDQNFINKTIYIWDDEFDRNIAKMAWISFVKIWKEGTDAYEIDKTTDLIDYIPKVK